MRFAAILLSLAVCAPAAEYAVLTSGARMRVDRHEFNGAKVKLFIGDSTAEMNAADVQRYEPEDYIAPAPPPPAVKPETQIPPVAPPAPARTPQQLADQAADEYGLPRWLVRSVMHTESGFQPNAVSPKGAIGLMQLMPGTAQALGVDPTDPLQNVEAGARYLRDLLVKYDGALWHALAAYNAGPGAVDKYNGVPPYSETRRYVSRIDQDRKKADAATKN